MLLKFESKLGHTVTHRVIKTGLNTYETTARSGLILIVNGRRVSLQGGYARFNTRRKIWQSDSKPHFYNQPIFLGQLI